MNGLSGNLQQLQNNICAPTMTIRLVSWNVQRLSLNSPQDKLNLVRNHLSQWMQPHNFQPHIIFLCEITRNGANLANNFNQLNQNYQAQFFVTKDRNGNPSDASFMLLKHNNIQVVEARDIGRDTRRPYIEVMINKQNIEATINTQIRAGFCHIIPNQGEASIAEIIDFISNLDHGLGNLPNFLIGDMNFAFNTPIPDEYQPQIEQNNWRRISPGFPTFFYRRLNAFQELDYIWINDRFIDCQPHELIPNYFNSATPNGTLFRAIIDHAPIAYEITYEIEE